MITLSDRERELFIRYLEQEIAAIDEEHIRRRIAGLGKIRWDSELMIRTSLQVVHRKLRMRPTSQPQSAGIILRP